MRRFTDKLIASRCRIRPLLATARMSSPAGAPTSPASAIDFLMLLQSLKTTVRTGWVRCQVAGRRESIADHMYRMAMMALVAGDCGGVDSNRCIRMAIVHDVAEALVGDITPHCNVSKEEKQRLEAEAIQRMADMLGEGTAAAAQVTTLWREYEEGSTPESNLVKDFDKLEMIIQAFEYETSQEGLDLQQFFDSTAGKFQTELGRAWAAELVSRRQARSSPS